MGPLSTLLKIQELEIVLKESAIVHDEEVNTESIQETLEELRAQVPETMLNTYNRNKKNGLGIAQEINGRCKACHMSVPQGTINRIQSGNQDATCPNCSVYIYLESFNEDY